jgi:chemotaxis-related protein WspB
VVPAGAVVEVTHSVPLSPLETGNELVAGAFRFRGRVTPVLDLCHLLSGHPCPQRLRTRIVVVHAENDPRLLGLLAEEVLDLRTLVPDGPEYPPASAKGRRPPLGAIVSDAEGLVRLPNVAELVAWVYARSSSAEAPVGSSA